MTVMTMMTIYDDDDDDDAGDRAPYSTEWSVAFFDEDSSKYMLIRPCTFWF